MTRQEIYQAIDEECVAGEQAGHTPVMDDSNSVADWIATITQHAGFAAKGGDGQYDEARFRRQMFRVAGIAVKALESQERRMAKAQSPAAPKSIFVGNRGSGV
jgi:hypothetical protein